MLPTPPYTYDDPRILYNEICFYYDGGYDTVCLAGPVIIGKGGRSTGKRRKEKTVNDFFNFYIEIKLKCINEIPYEPDKESEWFRYSGENEVIDIVIGGVKINIDKPMIQGKFLEAVKQAINYQANLEQKSSSVEKYFVSSSFYHDASKALKIKEKIDKQANDDVEINCELIYSNSIKEET